MHIKYKNLALLIIVGLALVVSTTLTISSTRPLKVFADPVPTCGTGATLVRPTNGNPAYCSCPAGQVLITGPVNNCAAASSCPAGSTAGTGSDGQSYCNPPAAGNTCASADNPGVCQNTNKDTASTGACSTNSNCDIIGNYINPAITVLSGLVGVVAVISIIYGGIQYASSSGDPQKVTAAKARITKTIAALVAYAFLYAFLQFLIPGGLFNR